MANICFNVFAIWMVEPNYVSSVVVCICCFCFFQVFEIHFISTFMESFVDQPLYQTHP